MDTPLLVSDKDYWVSNRPPSRARLWLAAVAVAVVFYAALYLSTERYRVYANDWLPTLDWWNFVEPMTLLKLVGGFGLVAGFSFVVLRAAVKERWLLGLFLLLLPIFAVSRVGIINQRHIDRTASCANHSGVWWWVPEPGNKLTRPLPASTEFADALAFYWEGEQRSSNLHSATCPGYRLTGTKTGAVFIGGGLTLANVKGGQVLLAFCDWRCHPVPHDHLHAQVWDGEHLRRECMHNKDIIPAIERALKAAESGDVPYSPEAVAEMREQLARRKAMVR